MTHPLVSAMTDAGSFSQRVAANLQMTNYTCSPDGIAPDDRYAMSLLADALIHDQTRHSALNDHQMLTDRRATPRDRANARERRELRQTITETLTSFPLAYRRQLIDALAEGRGPAEGKALEAAADARLRAILFQIQHDAAAVAQHAA